MSFDELCIIYANMLTLLQFYVKIFTIFIYSFGAMYSFYT